MADVEKYQSEMRELFVLAINNGLSAQQTHRLNDLLRQAPELRRYYLKNVEIYYGIKQLDYWMADVTDVRLFRGPAYRELIRKDLDESAIRKALRADLAEEEQELSKDPVDSSAKDCRPFGRRDFLMGVVKIAAMLLLAASVVWLDRVIWRQASQRSVNPPRVVASLTSTLDAVWSGEMGILTPGMSLYNRAYSLQNGFAEVTFPDGTTVVCEGPVDFTLENEQQLFLNQGELTVRVSKGSQFFTVRSPLASVVDFGTEFGLAVDHNGKAETHVFEGRVELRSGPDPRTSEKRMRLAAGHAGQANVSGELVSTPFDAYRFVRSNEYHIKQRAAWGSEPDRRLAYLYELRRNPDIAACFNFDISADHPGRIVNQAGPTAGCLEGRWECALTDQHPELTAGRWPDRAALHLIGNRHERIRIAPAKDLCISGPVTVAVWVRGDASEGGGHLISSQLADQTNYSFSWFGPAWNNTSGIVQFEAESGALGNEWFQAGVAGSSGGIVIGSGLNDTGTAPVSDGARAIYRVPFTQAGQYDLFVRCIIPTRDTEDSLYIAPNFGSPALGKSDDWLVRNDLYAGSNTMNRIQVVANEGEFSRAGSGVKAGEVVWINWSASFSDKGAIVEPVDSYNVPAPGTYEFQIAHRQSGFQIDAIAFVLTDEADRVAVDINGSLRNRGQVTTDRQQTSRLRWVRGNSPDGMEGVYSRPVSLSDDWNLIAVTHDNQTVNFYVNGALLDSRPYAFNAKPVICDTIIGDGAKETLGSEPPGPFNGDIDELQVYKRALSAPEIKQLYLQTNHRNF